MADVAALTRPIGPVSMKVNTAIAFLLCAFAVDVTRRPVEGRRLRLAQLSAGGALIIGGVTIAEYALSSTNGIDNLLAEDTEEKSGVPGRMALTTAVSFVLVGGAVLLRDRSRALALAGHTMLVVVTFVSCLDLLGHAFGVSALTGIAGQTRMAAHTAMSFVLVSAAVMLSRPHDPIPALLLSDTLSGTLARRLLVPVMLVPLAIGWLRLHGERSGLYDAAFGVALMVITTATLLAGVTLWTSRRLQQAELFDRRLRDALAASESYLATALHSIGDGVIATDAHGSVTRMNRVAEQLTGWTSEQAAGRALTEVFVSRDEETGQLVPPPVERILQDGVAHDARRRITLIGRDGRQRPIAETASSIRSHDGHALGVVVVFRDIAAERVAAQQRYESDLRNEATLASALDAIITIDHEGTVIEFNPAAERTFGYTRLEALGRPLTELIIPSELRDDHRRGLRRVVDTGLARVLGQRLELPALRKDGTRILAEVSISRIGTSEPPVFTGFIRDISERKQLEEEQRKSAELAAQNAQIREASRLKTEFLANMSHELRTPLNAVIGFTNLLHDEAVGPLNAQQREFLGDVLVSARHLLRLIDDVLDLSKIEAGKMEFQPERVSLSPLVSEVCSTLRATAAAKQIGVSVSVDPSLVNIVIDPGRFKQVLYNYLSNALKFTPDRGRVDIRALCQGELHFRLEVEDNGPGIAVADIRRLFVEFQQLDLGAAKQHSGTGLGLAVTKRLVEAQGGSVDVRSQPGVGTVFSAVMPRDTRNAVPHGVRDDRALARQSTSTRT